MGVAADDRVWTLAFRVYQWPIDDLKKILDEIDDDRRYHREQAQMMHEYRTKAGRFAPPSRIHFKLIGFTGEA